MINDIICWSLRISLFFSYGQPHGLSLINIVKSLCRIKFDGWYSLIPIKKQTIHTVDSLVILVTSSLNGIRILLSVDKVPIDCHQEPFTSEFAQWMYCSCWANSPCFIGCSRLVLASIATVHHDACFMLLQTNNSWVVATNIMPNSNSLILWMRNPAPPHQVGFSTL